MCRPGRWCCSKIQLCYPEEALGRLAEFRLEDPLAKVLLVPLQEKKKKEGRGRGWRGESTLGLSNVFTFLMVEQFNTGKNWYFILSPPLFKKTE